jgi:hypothetical protein
MEFGVIFNLGIAYRLSSLYDLAALLRRGKSLFRRKMTANRGME